MRICCLFNHDAGHHAAHLAGTVAELAEKGALHVEAICATEALRRQVAALIPQRLHDRIGWTLLPLPSLLDGAGRLADHVAPARRLLRLAWWRDYFTGFDLLVSTERTCLVLKRWLGERAPAFAIIPHGAGDRNVSNHPDFRKFDLVMVAGDKVIDQMVSAGVRRSALRVIGYPKFDLSAGHCTPPATRTKRPIFVYNPHFDPHLSSWYHHGPALLDWFARGDGRQFDLIFAPHVMLFRKRWHWSPEYCKLRRRPDIPDAAARARNITIDTGSPQLCDMSHMRAADAYIGDMSSQIYEFIQRPRAAFFIDSRNGHLGEHPPLHWQSGPVARQVAELAALLPDWQGVAGRYRDAQKQLFRYSFDTVAEPAAQRAAGAIIQFLESRRRQAEPSDAGHRRRVRVPTAASR